VFEDGLADVVADVVLARVFTVLPFLIAAEVEQLGDVVQYQITYRLPAKRIEPYQQCNRVAP